MTSDARVTRQSPHAIELTFHGLRIDVSADTPAPLDWLDEFVSPQLRDGTAPTARRRIAIHLDAARHDALLADGPIGHATSPWQIDCFTLDGQFARHTLWRDGDAGRVVGDADSGVFVAFHAQRESGDRGNGPPDVELIATQDSRRLRLMLMRVVRELATLHALRQGDVHVHGSAVVRAGRAVVFAGQKRAGKTSMLLNALRQPGSAYLSNDRVLVEPRPGGAVVRGMPTIVKVRDDCLTHLPPLPPPGPREPCMTRHECTHGATLIDGPAPRPGAMSPAQLCDWLDVPASAAAPLAAIVYPRVDPGVDAFEIRVLDAEASADRLAEALFHGGPSDAPPEAFVDLISGPSPADAVGDRCARFVDNHACFDCRIGPRAFATPDVWSAIVTSLDLR